MEILTGIMIAILIFYASILMSKGEVDINNFFSFLAAMMLLTNCSCVIHP